MPQSRPIRIAVIGTRGFPGVQGGVETHCQALYPRIAAFGHEIIVFGRAPYLQCRTPFVHEGAKIVPLPCPRSQHLEAIAHTFLAVLACLRHRPDVVHFHAIGPALLTPLARLLGFKVVLTHHGPDYERKKWGRLARKALELGEQLGCRFAHRIIVISRPIQRMIAERHGRDDGELIFNGVNSPADVPPQIVEKHLSELGLEPGGYVLALGRLVPEKGFHDLVEAVSGLPGIKLVIAGDADHPTPYSSELRARAAEIGAVMPGFVKGERLQSLLAGAGLFVLPSYHEGLPISLLEAMSHGLDVLVSDIPANRAVDLPETHYVPVGDVGALRRGIQEHLAHRRENDFIEIVRKRYDWDRIAVQTAQVYEDLIDARPAPGSMPREPALSQ